MATSATTDIAAADRFLGRLGEIIADLTERERPQIAAAADACATAIAADGFVHLFGAGHSHMPCCDVYPRIGGIEGFYPIVETALSRFTPMIGPDGLLQGTFLEQVEGYGEVILQSAPVGPPDAMIVFSHSGINAVGVDVALGAAARGVKVIGVTSREHSLATNSRHSSGKRLLELADVVIDTGVPRGDSLVALEGLEVATGSASTIVSMAVAQAIVAGTAERLLAAGITPTQIHSHNQRDDEEHSKHTAMEVATQAWGRRLGRRLAQYDVERKRGGDA